MFKVVKFDFFFFFVLNRPSSISSCFSVCSFYNMVGLGVQSRFVYLKEKLEKKKRIISLKQSYWFLTLYCCL